MTPIYGFIGKSIKRSGSIKCNFASKQKHLITIISGTNRTGSVSLRMAGLYATILESMEVPHKVLSLEHQAVWEKTPTMQQLEQEYLIPAEKFIFILPEYNASYPGIVKTMIDNSDIKKCWWHKKALLTGISEGRAGNIRGLEHMTSILHYMRVNVHYNKLILSRIKTEIDANGLNLKAETRDMITEQVSQFIAY
ncbi:MAG: NADPH-dependent FMN reductase [Chitinophagia bacterium]|nr:NADPH-dependent FMN reductase [Chitinophagia bacterium]